MCSGGGVGGGIWIIVYGDAQSLHVKHADGTVLIVYILFLL